MRWFLISFFGLVIVKPRKTKKIIPICPSYYMPQNSQNTISSTALKHYNKFTNERTEALIWVHMTKDIWIKSKVETSSKDIYQQLLDLITIDILKIEHQHHSSKEIINLPMNPIINSYFNKHPMSWELIRRHLLHPSESVMKSMYHHQSLDGLPKQIPRKIHKVPFKFCYKAETKNINKGATVDTSNLQLW